MSAVLGEQGEGQRGSGQKEKSSKGGGCDHEARRQILRDSFIQGRDFRFYFQCDENSWAG